MRPRGRHRGDRAPGRWASKPQEHQCRRAISREERAAEVGEISERSRGAHVEGSIAGARNWGQSGGRSIAAAASGAIKGAGEIGGTAVEQVRKAMTDVIAGVKVVGQRAVSSPNERRLTQRARRRPGLPVYAARHSIGENPDNRRCGGWRLPLGASWSCPGLVLSASRSRNRSWREPM